MGKNGVFEVGTAFFSVKDVWERDSFFFLEVEQDSPKYTSVQALELGVQEGYVLGFGDCSWER